MKLLAPLGRLRQSEADRAAHHAVMGNLLSLHVSIHQLEAEAQETGGDGHALVGQDYLSQRREILEPGAEEPKCQSCPGIAGLRGQLAKRGQITVAGLEPEPPDCDEKQPSEQDSDGGHGVVSADHPGVEVGGVIEQRILAGHGKRPVEETPCGAGQAAKNQDRIAYSHGAGLRRFSGREWSGF